MENPKAIHGFFLWSLELAFCAVVLVSAVLRDWEVLLHGLIILAVTVVGLALSGLIQAIALAPLLWLVSKLTARHSKPSDEQSREASRG